MFIAVNTISFWKHPYLPITCRFWGECLPVHTTTNLTITCKVYDLKTYSKSEKSFADGANIKKECQYNPNRL